MNLANISPLTAPPRPGPLTLTAEQYQSRVGSMLSRVDKMELMIRGLIDEENKQERISELGGRIYDIAVPGRGGLPDAHPVFENIMKMRREMSEADYEIKSQKRQASNMLQQLEILPLFALQDEPELTKYVSAAYDRNYETVTDDFVKDIYKKLSTSFGKKEIKLDADTGITFDTVKEPDAYYDEQDYDTEYKKDEEGISYAHITKTEKKVYDLFSNIPYKLEETIEYSWDVDTYTDEYGDEVADDEDLDYSSADTKTSYKLVRK